MVQPEDLEVDIQIDFGEEMVGDLQEIYLFIPNLLLMAFIFKNQVMKIVIEFDLIFIPDLEKHFRLKENYF